MVHNVEKQCFDPIRDIRYVTPTYIFEIINLTGLVIVQKPKNASNFERNASIFELHVEFNGAELTKIKTSLILLRYYVYFAA